VEGWGSKDALSWFVKAENNADKGACAVALLLLLLLLGLGSP
jgi:hypothetical protein